MPKRSCKVLPLGEKMKVNKERKKLYAEVAKICLMNESSIHEIVKKEKEIRASFFFHTSYCEIYGYGV